VSGSDAATSEHAEVAAPPPRMVITGGGRPDAAQLAALVVALTPGRSSPPGTGPPAWRRAALLEGIGGATNLSPGDLEVSSPRRR
jgi:hypothetical protein